MSWTSWSEHQLKIWLWKRWAAEGPAGNRAPSDGGASGGGQPAWPPFIIPCAHIFSLHVPPLSFWVRALRLIRLSGLLTGRDPALCLPGGPPWWEGQEGGLSVINMLLWRWLNRLATRGQRHRATRRSQTRAKMHLLLIKTWSWTLVKCY